MPVWIIAVLALLALNGLVVAIGYRWQTAKPHATPATPDPAAPEEGNR